MFKQSFDSMLAVNNTYTIANLQVLLNEILFKPSGHKFLLVFTSDTSVYDKKKYDLPPKTL